MRIVMLSCNTGEGHNSTARAIQEVLTQRGVECALVDVLACLSPRFSKFVCSWHVRLYKYMPKLWDAGYCALEHKTLPVDDPTALAELLSLGVGKLRELLEQGRYDAVVCVHVFSGLMMTRIRKEWGSSLPCYFVATDYTCYPYVEKCDMDGYFIPAAGLVGEFVGAGIPKEKLIASGIPVRQEFYARGDRKTAREKLSLSEYDTVAILMGGSMGCGPMKRIGLELVERMPERSVVIAMCGKNEKLFEMMSSVSDPRLRVLGYTGNVSEYMDAADYIITKPGGLSSTEAANKQLPMVFINAVGGCESRNFNFFLNRGYAVGAVKPEKVVALAAELAANPEKRAAISAALETGFCCNSAAVIADELMRAGARRLAGGMEYRIEAAVNGNPLDSTEGGTPMENLKNETILNLARSFAGESQARTRYTVYAQVARKEGMEWIARIFEETAGNEAVHAEEFLEMLEKLGGCAENIDITAGYPYQLGTTVENLAFAAAGELHEYEEAYPAFAELARREGYNDAALLWLQISRIEGVHHNTFLQLQQQLSEGTLTKKDKPVVWRCLNCGFTYEGPNACDPCPVCKKDAMWQEGELDRKKLMEK